MSLRSVSLCFFWVLLTDAYEKCVRDGLYPHATDCGKFYSCAPQGPVLMQCPLGLHFNSKILVCDWPANAGCHSVLKRDCPSYPHPTDCARFYMCAPSGRVLVDCPAGLHFNPKFFVCDWPENVKCPASHNATTLPTKNDHFEDMAIFVNTHEPETIITEQVTTNEISRTPLNKPTKNSEMFSTNTEQILTDTEQMPSNQTAIFSTNTEPEIWTLTESNSRPLGSRNFSCDDIVWPHEQDCGRFYMASPAGQVELSCPQGLLFDSLLLQCDWAANVPCSGQTTLFGLNEETTTLPNSEAPAAHLTQEQSNNSQICENNVWSHPTDCASFYMCGPAGPVQEHCLEGMRFNPAMMLCDWDENVRCFDEKSSSTSTTSIIGEASSETAEESFTEAATMVNSEAPTICQNDIWPHPTDCTAFYMCSATGPVQQYCSEGMRFNPATKLCDWEDNVRCFDESTEHHVSTTLLDEEASSTSTASNNEAETSKESLTEASTIVNSEASKTCENDIWPHSTDCTAFYMCSATGPVQQHCSEGMRFNPATKLCDWEDNVRCFDKPTEHHVSTTLLDEEASPTSTASNEETSSQTSATEASTMVNSEASTICESNIWPHPTDCAAFYMCGSTGAVRIDCSEGLLFNRHLHVCDWPDNVECFPAVSTTESASPVPEQEFTTENLLAACRGESTWSHPTDCTKFFTCATTGPVEARCPDEKLFNPALLACDWPENVTCATQRSIKTTLTCESVIWPHPTDCAKFFTCDVERTCARGLLFNTASLVCDWPENVQCDKRASSRRIDSSDDICSLDRRGRYLRPDPNSCRHYWVCHHGVASKGSCSGGSLFNGVLNACVTFKESDRIKCLT